MINGWGPNRARLPSCGREFASLCREYLLKVTVPRWFVTRTVLPTKPPAERRDRALCPGVTVAGVGLLESFSAVARLRQVDS